MMRAGQLLGGRRRSAGEGFTLLEIILALAILAGALAILSESVRIAHRNARGARAVAQASLLAVSKLDEIAAGISPAEAVSGAAFEHTAEFVYSISVEPLQTEGLNRVEVTVTQTGAAGNRPITFSLVRWLTDPNLAALEEESAAAEEAEEQDSDE